MQSFTGMPTELDDALAANPIAHLRYAALLPADEATAILESQATTGEWREHPGEWLDAGRRLAGREHSPWSGNGFYEWLVEVVTASTLDHDLAQMIFEIVGQLLDRSPERTDLLDCLVRWFRTQATPGHAPICADLLRCSVLHGAHRIPAPLLPLVEWLLMNGAAELRATEQAVSSHTDAPPKHSDLLPILVETVAEHGRPELLEIALRCMLVARVPDCGWGSIDRSAGLWPQIEQAITHGASESLATDVIQRIGATAMASDASTWAPFAEPSRFPCCQRALLRALGDGRFGRPIAQKGWRMAFRQSPPGELPPFVDRRALLDAIEQLHQYLAFRGPATGSSAWTECLLDETLRFFGSDWLAEVALEPLHPFERLLEGTEEVTLIVERVLTRALATASPSDSVELARMILGHQVSDHGARILRARAALAAWVPETTSTSAPCSKPSLASLEAQLLRILNYPWADDHHGVRMSELLGARQAIAFEPLANDDQIRLEPNRIVLDPGFYQSTLSRPSSPEEATALCVLYFLHELIHVQQRINGLATVQIVRSTGAEMTLMHLDLGADHAACLLASTAFPRWDLLWLKNLTGRSLLAFPASTFHTQAARYRKAARLVSIRLDYLGRALGVVSSGDLGGGYLFADYGPAGGHLLVLRSASPLSLVKAAPLDPTEANVLWNAADPPGRLDEVDEVLRRALKHGNAGAAHG